MKTTDILLGRQIVTLRQYCVHMAGDTIRQVRQKSQSADDQNKPKCRTLVVLTVAQTETETTLKPRNYIQI